MSLPLRNVGSGQAGTATTSNCSAKHCHRPCHAVLHIRTSPQLAPCRPWQGHGQDHRRLPTSIHAAENPSPGREGGDAARGGKGADDAAPSTSAASSSSTGPSASRGSGGAADSDDDRPSSDDGLGLSRDLMQRLARLKALEEYKQELEKPETPDTLMRCAVLIAKHRYADSEVDEGKMATLLNDMARRVETQLPETRYPLKVLQVINQVMYRDFGFRGSTEDYYLAENSCINKVMERRVGIPISLSLVYMEVARRVGLPMVGINLPLHFMIKPALEGVDILVDAFKGEICYRQDAEDTISDLMGARVHIEPSLVQGNKPLPLRKFLYRMLTNLRAIYFTTTQVDHALSIVQYMRATDGSAAVLLRDEGLCYFALKRYPECLDALREYLQADTSLAAEERHTMAQVIEEAKRRMKLQSQEGQGKGQEAGQEGKGQEAGQEGQQAEKGQQEGQ